MRIRTYVLMGVLALFAPMAHAAGSVATQADLDTAIATSLGQEDSARGTITALLQRDEVRTLAAGRGLDLRRAEAAVRTLEGDELQRLSLLAASVDTQLAGGDQVISISLVTLLLIVIIVILLA